MLSPIGVRRVILVVLNGLRPDAIDTFGLNTLRRIRAGGSSTTRASTVAPSVSGAAMTSLLTGVGPQHHGVPGDRLPIARDAGRFKPMPAILAESAYPTSGFIASVPALLRGVTTRIAARLGLSEMRCAGEDSPGILHAARHTLSAQRRGLIVMHWPDADRAGHSRGWMSDDYVEAAVKMDSTLGLLMALAEIPRDRGTLLIALSDHDSDHELDRRIFISMIGGGVQPGQLPADASILDVPATILWALGVSIPKGYAGSPLRSAFMPQGELEPVAMTKSARTLEAPLMMSAVPAVAFT